MTKDMVMRLVITKGRTRANQQEKMTKQRCRYTHLLLNIYKTFM